MNKLLFLLLCFSFHYIHVTPDTYRSYATSWAERYLYDAEGALIMCQEDLDLIRQLVDSSLHRSMLTLSVQNQAWQAVTTVWQGWQNFAQTRLNPSREKPYLITSEDKEQAIKAFWHILEEQEDACREYDQRAKEIVYGNALKTDVAKDAVREIRQQARVYMLDALTDVKSQLEALYDIAFKSHDGIQDRLKAFNIGSFLMNYVPNLVVHKFVEADAFYTTLSQDGWTILEKIQLIGNQAWYAIETSRSQFYRSLLEALPIECCIVLE